MPLFLPFAPAEQVVLKRGSYVAEVRPYPNPAHQSRRHFLHELYIIPTECHNRDHQQ
nr:hypothetical protein Iba_chr09eCG6660 [Ipomoea batatas]